MRVRYVFHRCAALCDDYPLQSIPTSPCLKFQRLESLVCLGRPTEASRDRIPHSG